MQKFLVTMTLLTLATTAQAAPFANGDPASGKKLFDKYQCNSCHIDMVGGDGNAVFTRPNRKVSKPEQLSAQMKRCSGVVGANISAQEEEHLAAYLNQKFYKFK
jgi:cytochrome c2